MPSVARAAKPASRYPAVVGTSVPDALDALDALGEVELDIRTLEVKRIALIGAAQAQGASWGEIGAALGVSRQAAWEKYRDLVRAALEVTAARAQHSEEAILASAADALKEVRARRQR